MEIEVEILGKGTATVEIDDRNPETAGKIMENLPIEGNANIYLEEVYFDIKLPLNYENPSQSAKKGDVSYWPPGSAFCIFYGDSQPYSEVNHIGKVTKNLELFFSAEDGDRVIIKRV